MERVRWVFISRIKRKKDFWRFPPFSTLTLLWVDTDWGGSRSAHPLNLEGLGYPEGRKRMWPVVVPPVPPVLAVRRETRPPPTPTVLSSPERTCPIPTDIFLTLVMGIASETPTDVFPRFFGLLPLQRPYDGKCCFWLVSYFMVLSNLRSGGSRVPFDCRSLALSSS